MNRAAIRARLAAEDAAIAGYEGMARAMVERHLDAIEALALQATGDRFSRPEASGPYQAAQNRFPSLLVALKGHVERVRSSHYRDALSYWRETMPSEALAPERGTNPARIQQLWAHPLHGKTLEGWLGNTLDGSAWRLRGAVAMAARSADPAVVLRAWRQRTEDDVNAAVVSAISHGVTLADRMAIRDLVKPELLHPDPTLPADVA